MSGTPLLSVVILTHQRPAFLQEALRSVADNGFSGELEIIVSDDDANQSARAVVEQFGDARVHYTAKPPPADIAVNSQHALLQTKGRYCFKLDDDDLILRGFLARCVGILETEPAVGSVYTGYDAFDVARHAHRYVIDREFFGPGGRVSGERYIRGVLVNEGGYPLNQKTTMVYRRELAARFNFYEGAPDDYAFSVALAIEADVAYIPEPLYQWRRHDRNFTGRLSRVWKMSRRALDKLEQIPTVKGRPALSARWPQWIDQCRQALPLFYLQAALRHESRGAAWSLWREMRAERALKQPLKSWILLVGGSLLPQWIHEAFFRYYQKSPRLQRLARTILTTG
jgi:glycosyltransferase involved in cell wall biosynthesis